MTLADVIRRLDQLEGELCIYAAPRWRASSSAAALREPDDGSLPEHARGMTYLTTVGEARRVVVEQRRRRPDLARIDQLCDAVVYYAVYNETNPLASELSADIDLPLAI